MFLFNIASRAATRSNVVLLSSAASPSSGEGTAERDLRRYETLPTADMPPGPKQEGDADDEANVGAESAVGSFAAAAVSAAELAAAHAEAEAAAMRAAAVEAAAAELAGKVARLRAMLAERDAADDEGARVQRAVQRQEEQDSLKMIALLRAQDEAFAAELAEAKASVEAATVRKPSPLHELRGPRYYSTISPPHACFASRTHPCASPPPL